MYIFSGLIISAGSLLCSAEAPHLCGCTVQSNVNLPFVFGVVPAYTFEPTLVLLMLASIAGTLGRSSLSQIAAAIVDGVVIGMIASLIWHSLGDLLVHVDWMIAISPDGVSIISAFFSRPIPLRKPLKVRSVNYRIQSLRKRDESVGWVQRLGHCMAFHAAFRHFLTSNEKLLPTAILAETR